MKGIILAGGLGSRLYPLTKTVSKHLLPVYNKPMIYYPLSTLMMSGINEILIISTPFDLPKYRRLLGTGSDWGLNFHYAPQRNPRGIAEALIIGESFINGGNVALILGDNIFYGTGLGKGLSELDFSGGSTIFGYRVSNPQDYGVISFDKSGLMIDLEEKPKSPKSNIAIPGFYFFDKKAPEFVRQTQISSRNELEIISVLKCYLEINELKVIDLPRGTTWMDAGTFDGLLEISQLIKSVEMRQGQKICIPEEVSWKNGWISRDELKKVALQNINLAYRDYLLKLLDS